MDNIFLGGDNSTIDEFKAAFNSSGFSYNDDFAYIVSQGIGGWQGRNWDPAVNDPSFSQYCGNLTSSENQYPDLESLRSNITQLIQDGGYSNETDLLVNPMLNLIGWTEENYIDACDDTLDNCYGAHNASSPDYTDKDLSNYGYLSWPWQYCTEYGFLQSGSTVPPSAGLPLISKLITLDYNALVCNFAFNRTEPADTDRVNKYGGFNISYPRLAIIGGEQDPWRPATPLATLDVPDRLNDSSTVSQPIVLIQGAVHHWDENGLFANETTADLPPQPVANAQYDEKVSVQSWMAEWQLWCMSNQGVCNNLS